MSPADNAVDVPASTTITVSFKDPIVVSTITPESFLLLADGTPVAGTVNASPDGLFATLSPAATL